MLTGIMETSSNTPASRSLFAAASRRLGIADRTTYATRIPPISSATRSSATSRAAPRPRAGFVDRYGASAEFLAVECTNGSQSLCSGRHLHKGESLGAARFSILNYVNLLHLAVCFESFA